MSLINDALKRAKEVQQNQPPVPPPDLQFRPADPAPPEQSRPSFTLMVVTVVVLALVGLTITFILRKHSAAQKVTAAARPVTRPEQPVKPVPEAKPKPSPVVAPSAVPPKEIAAAKTKTQSAVVAATTNAIVAEATSAPQKPPLPRLQGITYLPGRPTAVVDGKTVFIGSFVGELRVLAISRQAVTLASATETNVLNLSE